jgi:hypothetical protein
MEKEFNIDDTVTVDRYNHIDDAEKGIVVGLDETMGGEVLYKINIREIVIRTTGRSIMESKMYDPLPEKERHAKIINKQDRIARWIAYVSSK